MSPDLSIFHAKVWLTTLKYDLDGVWERCKNVVPDALPASAMESIQ